MLDGLLGVVLFVNHVLAQIYGAGGPALGACAVVRHQQHGGVLINAEGFKLVKQTTNVRVGVRQECGISFL